jgi:hypothetical protein
MASIKIVIMILWCSSWWCWSDTQLAYSHKWDQDPVAALEHCQELGPFFARYLDFRHSFISLYWRGLLPHHSTINRYLCVSSSGHTHKTPSTFLLKGSWQLQQETVAFSGALALTLLLTQSSFFYETNHQFIYVTIVSDHCNAHSAVQHTQHLHFH